MPSPWGSGVPHTGMAGTQRPEHSRVSLCVWVEAQGKTARETICIFSRVIWGAQFFFNYNRNMDTEWVIPIHFSRLSLNLLCRLGWSWTLKLTEIRMFLLGIGGVRFPLKYDLFGPEFIHLIKPGREIKWSVYLSLFLGSQRLWMHGASCWDVDFWTQRSVITGLHDFINRWSTLTFE